MLAQPFQETSAAGHLLLQNEVVVIKIMFIPKFSPDLFKTVLYFAAATYEIVKIWYKVREQGFTGS